MKQLDSNRLGRTLRTVVGDLQTMANATGEQVSQFGTRTRRQLHDVRDRIGVVEREAAWQLRVAGRQTQGYVRAHPWRVFGGVAAVAVAIALVSRRRH